MDVFHRNVLPEKAPFKSASRSYSIISTGLYGHDSDFKANLMQQWGVSVYIKNLKSGCRILDKSAFLKNAIYVKITGVVFMKYSCAMATFKLRVLKLIFWRLYFCWKPRSAVQSNIRLMTKQVRSLKLCSILNHREILKDVSCVRFNALQSFALWEIKSRIEVHRKFINLEFLKCRNIIYI